MSVATYKTKQGALYFDGGKCIHSRNCVLNRPDVFVPNVKGEWIHPERASSGELQEIADNCPSGAIRYEETGHTVNRVQQVHLCRCGHLNNKPYCDGAHSKAEFTTES